MLMSFGEYLRSLRQARGPLSINRAAEQIGISSPYLSQLESGHRGPPKPDILKKLAAFYQVGEREMMERAGYLEPEATDEDRIRLAYRHAVTDPEFRYGTRVTEEPTLETMKFIVEIYEKLRGRRLLNP